MANTGSAIWDGVVLPLPGTYGFINPSGLSFQSTPNSPVVYLIGNSVGGQPGTVLGPFYTYLQAAAVLKGGDLLNAAKFAFRMGAGQVAAYRVSNATQSSLTLKDSLGNPSVVLTSADYGQWTNSLLASVSGTVPNLVLTIVDQYDQQTYTSPPLGGAFTLTYTGNGTSANVVVAHGLQAPTVGTLAASTTGGSIPASTTVYVKVVARNSSGYSLPSAEASVTTGSTTSTNSVTVPITANPASTSYDVYVGTTSGGEVYYGNFPGQYSGTINAVITSLPTGTVAPPSAATAGDDLVTWISGQTDGTKNLDINLDASSVSTVRALASYIAGQPGYTTSLVQAAGNIPSSQLDTVNGQSILGSGYLLTSAIGSVVNWANSTGVVVAQKASGATNPPAPIGLTPFVGGSDGTSSVSNWQQAANLVQSTNPVLRYTVPLTSTIANISAVLSSVENAASPPSTILGEVFAGGAIGETPQIAKQNAATLGNRRAVYAGCADFFDYDSNGVYTHFPGYMMAAVYAGLRSALPAQMPLTGKTLNVLQLAQTLSPSTIQDLNNNGVAAPYLDASGNIEISLGTTTDVSSSDYNNLYFVEESVGNSIDSLVMWLTNNLNKLFKGQPNYGNVTSQMIIAEINSELSTATKPPYQWISGFVPVTSVTQLQSNPTYLVVPITVYVVSPINGMILNISLQLPVQLAATA